MKKENAFAYSILGAAFPAKYVDALLRQYSKMSKYRLMAIMHKRQSVEVMTRRNRRVISLLKELINRRI